MSQELLSRDGLAARNGGVWDYISPSRLTTWLACPLKFKFRYIKGQRTPTSPAMFVGKAVHLGLEYFYRHRQLGMTVSADEVVKRLMADWDRVVADEHMVFSASAAEQACQNQALILVQAYLHHLSPDEPRPLAVEVAVEAPLIDPMTGENLGVPLVGIMDLVLPESDGPLIADFKTTSRSTEPLSISHEIQLSSYAYLFRQATATCEGGLEIRSLVKTKVPQVQFHCYGARTDKHFRRLFAVIRAYLDDLDAGTFLFRPGLGCTMCEFRGPCDQDG